MHDVRTEKMLQDIVRRQSRSLLQYVRDAFPWTKAEDRPTVEAVKALGEEQAEGIAALTKSMQRRRIVVPYLGSYPPIFTNYNFVTLAFLKPQLIKTVREEVESLSKNVRDIQDADFRVQVEQIKATNEKILAALEGNASAPPAHHVEHGAH